MFEVIILKYYISRISLRLVEINQHVHAAVPELRDLSHSLNRVLQCSGVNAVAPYLAYTHLIHMQYIILLVPQTDLQRIYSHQVWWKGNMCTMSDFLQMMGNESVFTQLRKCSIGTQQTHTIANTTEMH